jgi:hypothetical protein
MQGSVVIPQPPGSKGSVKGQVGAVTVGDSEPGDVVEMI